jgi:hypothetical protein
MPVWRVGRVRAAAERPGVAVGRWNLFGAQRKTNPLVGFSLRDGCGCVASPSRPMNGSGAPARTLDALSETCQLATRSLQLRATPCRGNLATKNRENSVATRRAEDFSALNRTA